MPAPAVPRVLFLCVRNAGRSQMAAAFAWQLGGGRIEALSAGSEPADAVHPVAVEAMREAGIDLSEQRPRRWSGEMIGGTDLVVTMGCGDSCPVLPGVRYVDWELDDPSGKPLEEVRPIRDEIKRRVQMLIEELAASA